MDDQITDILLKWIPENAYEYAEISSAVRLQAIRYAYYLLTRTDALFKVQSSRYFLNVRDLLYETETKFHNSMKDKVLWWKMPVCPTSIRFQCVPPRCYTDKQNDVLLNGELMHTFYGEGITCECVKLCFESSDDVHCIIPGKILHRFNPLLTCTPDGIGVKSYVDFINCLDNRDTITDDAKPLLTLEIKTLQSEKSVLALSTLERHLNAVRYLDNEKITAYWTDFLCTYFTEQKLYKQNNIDLRTCLYSSRSTHERVKNHYEVGRVRNVSTSSHVTLDDITDIGRGKLIIYECSKDNENDKKYEHIFDIAPFTLSLNHKHMNQVLEQHLILSSYNEKSRAFFAHVSRGYDDTAGEKWNARLVASFVYIVEVKIKEKWLYHYRNVINKLLTNPLVDGMKL